MVLPLSGSVVTRRDALPHLALAVLSFPWFVTASCHRRWPFSDRLSLWNISSRYSSRLPGDYTLFQRYTLMETLPSLSKSIDLNSETVFWILLRENMKHITGKWSFSFKASNNASHWLLSLLEALQFPDSFIFKSKHDDRNKHCLVIYIFNEICDTGQLWTIPFQSVRNNLLSLLAFDIS